MIARFNQPVELVVCSQLGEDGDPIEGTEVFAVGDTVEFDLIDHPDHLVNGELVPNLNLWNVQFGNGSMAFGVSREWFDLVHKCGVCGAAAEPVAGNRTYSHWYQCTKNSYHNEKGDGVWIDESAPKAVVKPYENKQVKEMLRQMHPPSDPDSLAASDDWYKTAQRTNNFTPGTWRSSLVRVIGQSDSWMARNDAGEAAYGFRTNGEATTYADDHNNAEWLADLLERPNRYPYLIGSTNNSYRQCVPFSDPTVGREREDRYYIQVNSPTETIRAYGDGRVSPPEEHYRDEASVMLDLAGDRGTGTPGDRGMAIAPEGVLRSWAPYSVHRPGARRTWVVYTVRGPLAGQVVSAPYGTEEEAWAEAYRLNRSASTEMPDLDADTPTKPDESETTTFVQTSTSACESQFDVLHNGKVYQLRLWITFGQPALSFADNSHEHRYKITDTRWETPEGEEWKGHYPHQDPNNIQGPTFDVLPNGIETVAEFIDETQPKPPVATLTPAKRPQYQQIKDMLRQMDPPNEPDSLAAGSDWYKTAQVEIDENNEPAEPRCRVCNEPYAAGGDGWDGMCPACADKADHGEPTARCPVCNEMYTVELTDEGEDIWGMCPECVNKTDPNRCRRCGSELTLRTRPSDTNPPDTGFCTDQTCPFYDHSQECPNGWAGHPELGKAEVFCNCRRPADAAENVAAESIVMNLPPHYTLEPVSIGHAKFALRYDEGDDTGKYDIYLYVSDPPNTAVELRAWSCEVNRLLSDGVHKMDYAVRREGEMIEVVRAQDNETVGRGMTCREAFDMAVINVNHRQPVYWVRGKSDRLYPFPHGYSVNFKGVAGGQKKTFCAQLREAWQAQIDNTYGNRYQIKLTAPDCVVLGLGSGLTSQGNNEQWIIEDQLAAEEIASGSTVFEALDMLKIRLISDKLPDGYTAGNEGDTITTYVTVPGRTAYPVSVADHEATIKSVLSEAWNYKVSTEYGQSYKMLLENDNGWLVVRVEGNDKQTPMTEAHGTPEIAYEHFKDWVRKIQTPPKRNQQVRDFLRSMDPPNEPDSLASSGQLIHTAQQTVVNLPTDYAIVPMDPNAVGALAAGYILEYNGKDEVSGTDSVTVHEWPLQDLPDSPVAASQVIGIMAWRCEVNRIIDGSLFGTGYALVENSDTHMWEVIRNSDEAVIGTAETIAVAVQNAVVRAQTEINRQNQTHIACPVCHGTGASGSGLGSAGGCRICNGTGMVAPPPPGALYESPCERCGGDGWIGSDPPTSNEPSVNRACPDCNGTGKTVIETPPAPPAPNGYIVVNFDGEPEGSDVDSRGLYTPRVYSDKAAAADNALAENRRINQPNKVPNTHGWKTAYFVVSYKPEIHGPMWGKKTGHAWPVQPTVRPKNQQVRDLIRSINPPSENDETLAQSTGVVKQAQNNFGAMRHGIVLPDGFVLSENPAAADSRAVPHVYRLSYDGVMLREWTGLQPVESIDHRLANEIAICAWSREVNLARASGVTNNVYYIAFQHGRYEVMIYNDARQTIYGAGTTPEYAARMAINNSLEPPIQMAPRWVVVTDDERELPIRHNNDGSVFTYPTPNSADIHRRQSQQAVQMKFKVVPYRPEMDHRPEMDQHKLDPQNETAPKPFVDPRVKQIKQMLHDMRPQDEPDSLAAHDGQVVKTAQSESRLPPGCDFTEGVNEDGRIECALDFSGETRFTWTGHTPDDESIQFEAWQIWMNWNIAGRYVFAYEFRIVHGGYEVYNIDGTWPSVTTPPQPIARGDTARDASTAAIASFAANRWVIVNEQNTPLASEGEGRRHRVRTFTKEEALRHARSLGFPDKHVVRYSSTIHDPLWQLENNGAPAEKPVPVPPKPKPFINKQVKDMLRQMQLPPEQDDTLASASGDWYKTAQSQTYVRWIVLDAYGDPAFTTYPVVDGKPVNDGQPETFGSVEEAEAAIKWLIDNQSRHDGTEDTRDDFAVNIYNPPVHNPKWSKIADLPIPTKMYFEPSVNDPPAVQPVVAPTKPHPQRQQIKNMLRQMDPPSDPDSLATSTQIVKTAKEFWGTAGSGMLYVCPTDKTILLFRRSSQVEQPGTWGITGGAISGTEGFHEMGDESEQPDISPDDSRASAERETAEETGTRATGIDLTTTTYINGSFRYITYVVAVSLKEKQRLQKDIHLNWENDKFGWFPIAKLPVPLHFGVAHSLSQVGARLFAA